MKQQYIIDTDNKYKQLIHDKQLSIHQHEHYNNYTNAWNKCGNKCAGISSVQFHPVLFDS